MITLYNKKDAYIVIGGLVFYHILIIMLCTFWVHRFIFVSFNPDVLFLLALFIGGTIYTDVLISRIQGFSRFFLRCKVNERGIHCVGLGRKKWSIMWSDIRVYGITGFCSPSKSPLIFLSTDPDEKPNSYIITNISQKRIAFQATASTWNTFAEYMPTEMRKKIHMSYHQKRDCFYKQ